jgi:hypothetical protein
MSKRKAGSSSRGRAAPLKSLAEFTASLKCIRFAGVALGGGKTDRTAVVIVEYYPEHNKVFLRRTFDHVKAEGDHTADQAILDLLSKQETPLHSITFDTPLTLPGCLLCTCEAPGYEKCPRPEVQWMWKVFEGRKKSKRPNKMFTPYTERAAEIYISNFLEEPFHPHHALGANMAPLTARALYLKSRLHVKAIETYPRLALWRIGRNLKISKSHLRHHRHTGDGDESRLHILKSLIEREIAFIYQQDVKTLVENWFAFEAFICALVGFLEYREQTAPRPADFPEDSAWISFPEEKITWFPKP